MNLCTLAGLCASRIIRPVYSAAASGAEGRTIGFTLGVRSAVLNVDFFCAASVINRIKFAAAYVTAYAGIG